MVEVVAVEVEVVEVVAVVVAVVVKYLFQDGERKSITSTEVVSTDWRVFITVFIVSA